MEGLNGMRTLALVESPAQLLNVLEWAHQTRADLDRLSTIVLAPSNEMSRLQLRRTADLAASVGHTVHWLEPRQDRASSLRSVKALSAELRGVDRLVVGDAFSGVIQLILGVSRASEVVLVDDGSATIEFARLWANGESLLRWHSAAASGHRRTIAALARRRMAPGSGRRVSLFTCMPVRLDGAEVVRNDFSWVRSYFPLRPVKAAGDLIGSSLVETGVIDEAQYLAGVKALADVHEIDRYCAHRLEDADKLGRIERMGLTVIRPDLPLELVARRDSMGRTIVSFPSTVVHTLPVVLRGSGSELLLCDIADDWYTQRAPSHADRFLEAVATSARDTHGLLSTAC